MTDDDAASLEAQEQADFGSGFSGKDQKPPAKAETTAAPEGATEGEQAAAAPVYVQITAQEWAEQRAAAAKTASYDAQLAKMFGSIGNLQRAANEQKAALEAAAARGEGGEFKIPDESFAEMARDFPELAAQVKAALEGVFKGFPKGNGSAAAKLDETAAKDLMARLVAEHEIEILEDTYPDWRTIVGQVDASKEAADPNNPFRKWLAGKDATYQARINGTTRAAVLERSIRLFKSETAKSAAPSKPTEPRGDARAERIRGAMQPRGDGAAAPPGKTDDDEFAAGFKDR
jgi:hypothetical protein